MNEIAMLEQVIGGTLSGMAVLTIVAWKLWQRLGEKDAQSAALTREFLTAVASFRETVSEHSAAIDGLREVIEREHAKAPHEIRPARNPHM